VILGDNGSGKSSVLRAIALALLGPSEARALRQDWNDWLRFGETRGSVGLQLDFDRTLDKFAGKGRKPELYYLPVKLSFRRPEGNSGAVKLTGSKLAFNPGRHVWGEGAGWFSAGYGPFRRFAGTDKDYERIFYSNPKPARHLSLFGENVALTEALVWLQDLQFKKLEGTPAGKLLDPLTEFVNQEGFLPHNTRLKEVTSSGVIFKDGNQCEVSVENLSDGYRSILSMTFELIRQLASTFGSDKIFDRADPTRVIVPGVVLIDEADAHLHPTWQRRLGSWFRKHFPKLQFIVTTHSPLICQAAEVGTVTVLPKPGIDEPSIMMEGAALQRLLYGNVLDAYSTGVFGEGVSRSEESIRRLERLAELNRKELQGRLSPKERKEQMKLRTTLPTAAHAIETSV